MHIINRFYTITFSNNISNLTTIFKRRNLNKYTFCDYFLNLVVYLYFKLKKISFIYRDEINHHPPKS